MIIFPWNFTQTKKEPLKKKIPSKFSNFFKVVEFKSNDLKIFINTLWYDNFDSFRLKMFFHWRFIWAKFFSNHLTQIRWNFDFFLKMLLNNDFLKAFIKLLVYIYTNARLSFNFIFMILAISFNFGTQIIYIWILE